MSPTFRTITALFVASSSIGAAPHGACPGHALQPEYGAAWADAYLRWTFNERDLPLDEHGNAVLGHTVFLPIPETPVLSAVEWRQHERANLAAALRRSGGRIYGAGGAAELLGVPPTTLASRLKALGVPAPGRRGMAPS